MTFRAFMSMDIGRLEALVRLIQELDSTKAQIKTVNPDLIHMTLKFLGEVEEAMIPGIVACMKESARGHAPFKVKLRQVGAFPSTSNVRVVWVGMDGSEPMKDMAMRLEAGLASLGFPKEERAFSPHVTLGRMKGPQGMARVKEVIIANQSKEFGELAFSSIRLKKSVLSPKGPSYSVVEEVELMG